ncbi:hypothetical protein HYPSUDRAFT_34195 [Hypholoma sublateritium FD-334 SS-4]|uniref:F-box domain-containing protein n=1 Tax=Hypholoma sublateritium (strain FD-334 SS-4) TaxID=945553 RepID=A0A0D2PAL7_HYPSF|nr:hypothetical protein HYPSUDRAFT_34195 [Hypholoma sublateritium FD-334 SS-4]
MEILSSPILLLPPEILVLILELLHLRDLLSIRQTCRGLSKITYERELWMKMLGEQSSYLPLPRDLLDAYRREDTHLPEHSDAEIESVVTEAEIMSELWTRWRPQSPYKLQRESVGNTLMGVKLFLDRWLLVVYFEGGVYLYDTQPPDPVTSSFSSASTSRLSRRVPILRAARFLDSGLWITHAVSIDLKGQTIFLALSRSAPPHMVQIYKINLAPLASESTSTVYPFHLLKSIPLPLYKVIRCMDPERKLIALSTSGLVEILNWDECQGGSAGDSLNSQTITVNADDQEGLWNGIIAVRFIGEYVLIFRTRSMEVLKYGPGCHSFTNSESPSLKHKFNMTFREVSFSETTTLYHPVSQTQTSELSLFAYDVIQGLFHYVVRVRTSATLEIDADGIYPSLEVILTGVYPLAVSATLSQLYLPLLPAHDTPSGASPAAPANTAYSANFTPSPLPTPLSTHMPARASLRMQSGLDGGARGFLSTQAIGAQGRRGMWIERKRASTLREIQVWGQASPTALASYARTPPSAGAAMAAVEIPRRIVHSLQSFDLRDDITCCAFGELSGVIVLGHRSGDISVLELNGDDS